jgi:hypothetical protein
VIGLVLDDAGREVVRDDVHPAAGAIQGGHPDGASARHTAADVGDAQAALPILNDFRAGWRNDRIDEHHRLVVRRQRVFALGRDGGDEDAQRLVNLRRREADTVVFVHGVDHVVNQLLQRSQLQLRAIDLARADAQHWMAHAGNLQQRHSVIIQQT